MTYRFVTVIAIIALVSVPAIVWLEKNKPQLWHDRLVLASFNEEPNRHTPRFPTSPYLPPLIKETTTIGGPNTTFVISAITRVPAKVTLSIREGTTIAFHEHAQLIVNGTLLANGTLNKRIHFVSNETHPENQNWSGLQFETNAIGRLLYTEFQHGNPAISCLPQSLVTIDHTLIHSGNVGLYTESATCDLKNSSIIGTLHSVIGRTVVPVLENIRLIGSQPPLIKK